MIDRSEVVVIGGGPSGSVAAMRIAAAGYSVLLLEKQRFPRETLCGEFLSAEVAQTISELGLWPNFAALLPNPLKTFTLLGGRGGPVSVTLGFTAYGVKRGKFDAMLLEAAGAAGVRVLESAEVVAVEGDSRVFSTRYKLRNREYTVSSRWVIGAYGKTSPLDKRLDRHFAGYRTGFTGVKCHLPADPIRDLRQDELVIALGPGMYCGVSYVGEEAMTVCLLERRRRGDSPPREKLGLLLRDNPDFARRVSPRLKSLFLSAPVYGAGNIFFGPRDVVANGVVMVGDAAGMIAPIAGDGIGIALQQARLLGTLFGEGLAETEPRRGFFERYRYESAKLFARRKRVALACQRIALSEPLRGIISPVLSMKPGLLQALILATRGRFVQPEMMEPA